MRMNKLEREGNAPAGWETDVVLERNPAGDVIRVEAPEEEEKDDAEGS